VLIAGSMRLCFTGAIFLGVDHLKHPSISAAERRSRPYPYRSMGERERRSVSSAGWWWLHDEGRMRLRYVKCGCWSDAPISIPGGVGRMR